MVGQDDAGAPDPGLSTVNSCDETQVTPFIPH
jgi:hypothetical protein